MRLSSVTFEGSVYPAVRVDGELRYLPQYAGRDAGHLATLTGSALAREAASAPAAPESARLLSPIPRPGKVVAIGLNYLDHIRESKERAPEEPIVFAKFPSSVVGPGEPIEIDLGMTRRVDWEVELTIVIGSLTRNVPVQRALDAVFGYTVGNDVSARDLQFSDGQWTRAKSLNTFCPLGPEIVTADEIHDPQDLRLATRVNGETMQDSSTSEMIFGVAELIAFCSQAFPLEPGDVILTGTPWGCGEFMTPQRHLQPGDEVETEIEHIGVLANPVVAVSRVAAVTGSEEPVTG